jgi:hypothetical protein
MDLSGATIEELNSELSRRISGVEALDGFFQLPVWVKKPELREGYEAIVARMRRECSHVPMNTVQQLLIERIAFNYIILKYREGAKMGTEAGFASPDAIKDFNTFWLKMTAEFNNLLVKFKPSDKEAVMGQVKDIVVEILATIPREHSDLRNDLVNRFVRTFERAGLVSA